MNHILLVYTNYFQKSLTFLFFFLLINSLCTAQSVSNSVNGSWKVPNEKDDYHDFIVIPQNASPGYVKVTLTQNDEDLRPAMVISRDLNKGGAIISGSSAKTNNPYNRTAYFSVHPGMTYSVRVYPFFNADTKDYPVPYTLSWEFTDRPDAYEPNDTRNDAKPIRLNEPIEAYAIAGYIKQYFIGSTDDNTYDWYQVTLDSSDRISAEVLEKPNDLDLNLRFITPAGRQVGTESVSTGNIKKIRTRNALDPGTYYLEVHQRMKGPRKSENDTKPIPDHFDQPYKLIVTDSNGPSSVAQNPSAPNPSPRPDPTPAPNPTAQGYTLADLAGVWERRASTISSWNGLRVNVTGTEGTVTDKAGSLFENGDVKWNALQKSGTDTFAYKELGTDGNYYAATIKFISKHELEVRVDSDASGNTQIWTRVSNKTVTPSRLDLASVQGKWRLVQSNNGNYDGMVVQLEGTTGTIVVEKIGGNYTKGSVKWKDITLVKGNEYAFTDINANGTGTISVIRINNENQLNIRLGASIAGNDQIWERLDGNSNSIALTDQKLPCHINTETRLINTGRDVDYIADCVIDVTAPLTIEPGVVIEFAENAGLGIYEEGSLKMVGTETEKIILRGQSKREGFWRGIHTDTKTEIEHAEIRHTGSNYVYCCNEVAAIMGKKGSLTVKNTIFGSNVGCKIFVHDGITHFQELGNSLSGSDICYQGPQAIDQYINSNTVLVNTPKPVDYYVPKDQVTNIGAELTIEAGVVIEFYENSGLKVLKGLDGKSKLIAIGNFNERIVFKGKEKKPGYWRGILSETRSEMEYVDVSDAGALFARQEKGAGIVLKSGILEIKHSNLFLNKGCGLLIQLGAIARISNNLYSLNETGGTCQDDMLPNHIFAPLVLEDTPRDVDYYVPTGQVSDVKAQLTIEPGVVIEFRENSGLGIYDQGKLVSIGSPLKKIEFKGAQETPGYWRGVHLETPGNIMDHMEISSAGGNFVYCCNDKAAVFVKEGDLKISNSYVHDNAGCGIKKLDAAFLDEGGNTFAGNAEGHICYGNPKPIPNQINTATTLVNTPKEVDYYVPSNQVVDVTAQLTIEPGVVIEFGENAGLGIYDTGSLIAKGYTNQKIVFKGMQSQPGYWRGIHMETTGNQLEHIDISSAGSNFVYCCNKKAAIMLKSGYLDISQSYIHDNLGCGIFVQGGGTLAESGNTFAANADGHICH